MVKLENRIDTQDQEKIHSHSEEKTDDQTTSEEMDDGQKSESNIVYPKNYGTIIHIDREKGIIKHCMLRKYYRVEPIQIVRLKKGDVVEFDVISKDRGRKKIVENVKKISDHEINFSHGTDASHKNGHIRPKFATDSPLGNTDFDGNEYVRVEVRYAGGTYGEKWIRENQFTDEIKQIVQQGDRGDPPLFFDQLVDQDNNIFEIEGYELILILDDEHNH